MIKKLSKTNLSLLIIMLCAVLFSSLFAISNLTSKKVTTAQAYEAGSYATLKGSDNKSTAPYVDFVWFTDLKYFIENIIITNDANKIPNEDITVSQFDASDENNGSITAYVYSTSTGYDCVIFANVETIYLPEESGCMFGPASGEEANEIIYAPFKYLKSIDFGCLNTSKVRNMEYMFATCQSIEKLDLSGFDMSNVEIFNFMFAYCENLKEIILPSNFFASCRFANGMFVGCKSLKSISFSNSNLNPANHLRNYFDNMFAGCESLEKLDVSSFDFSLVTTSATLNWFGVSDETILSAMSQSPFYTDGMTIEEYEVAGQNYFPTYLDAMFAEAPDSLAQLTETDIEFLKTGYDFKMIKPLLSMRYASRLKEIKTPENMGAYTIVLPTTVELYLNGTGDTSIASITSAEQNSTLLAKNTITPSTGFVSEQLLPMITISFVSILSVVLIVINKKRKYNI